ncbi:MAG: hypothetical protein QOJ26_645, partial [Thermoplasmata archaeon]|nr:hypothetical protein [Thermoplasmata archaeon]
MKLLPEVERGFATGNPIWSTSVGRAVGERIKAIESTAGRKVDDLAKALL